MNRKVIVWAASLCLMMTSIGMHAGENLSLKDIMSGTFRSEAMQAVRPLADGETYGQMSADGKRVAAQVSRWLYYLMWLPLVEPSWKGWMTIS